MFDFSKIKEIEMEYEYKDTDEKSFYSEVNGKGSRVISPNKETIRFTIQDDEKSMDDSAYQIILTKKDGKIELKGDFFEAPEEWYETSVTLTNEYALIISEDYSEKMILRCYTA
jgi:hypothetical protein